MPSTNPSAGAGAQTSELTVTSAGSVHTGGEPLAGIAGNPNVVRWFVPSHPALRSGAIHAAGTLPRLEESGTSVSAVPGQSAGTAHTWSAPPAVPSVR